MTITTVDWTSHVDGITVHRSVSQAGNPAPDTRLAGSIGQDPETVTYTVHHDQED